MTCVPANPHWQMIRIGDDIHEIPVRPLTLIYKSPELTEEIEYEGIRLEPEHCVYHGERVRTLHAKTPELVALVFEIEPEEVCPEWAVKGDFSRRHVFGRIDLSLKLWDQGVPLVWIFPEAGVHPKHQCRMGDLLIRLKGNTRPDEGESK